MKASEWMLNMTVINVFQYNDNDARLASVVASRARESEPLALLCFVFLILFAAARVLARCASRALSQQNIITTLRVTRSHFSL